MAVITKKSIANVVAGFAVVFTLVKGAFNGETTELEVMILGTSIGYLFGAATGLSRKLSDDVKT